MGIIEKFSQWILARFLYLWILLVLLVTAMVVWGFAALSLSDALQALFLAVQALLMFVLVLVTWMYARETRNISKSSQEAAEAAAEEAKASTRAAEEMRESRFASFQPIIVMGRAEPFGAVEGARLIAEQTSISIGTFLYNVGPGPALNLRFFRKEPSRKKPSATDNGPEVRALGPGEAYDLRLYSFGEKRQSRHDLTVEYEDIFDRKWCSGLELDYDAQGDQFTVLNLFYEKLD